MFDRAVHLIALPTTVLVEALLQRGGRAIRGSAGRDRPAGGGADRSRLRPPRHLAAAAERAAGARHGDDRYRDYRDRYRAMATSLGFEGHMKWAEAMP